MKMKWLGMFMFAVMLLPLAATSVSAQQTDPLQNPEITSIKSDQPRCPLLPYNKMDLAMSGNIEESTYLQWLNGTWNVRTFASPTEIDTLLTSPSVSVSGWNQVQVPQRTTIDGYASIYRTEFKMPFAWIDREVFVHIGAVSRAYYVYVNGREVGYFADAKSGAEFNITKYAVEGKNHLAIIAYADPVSTAVENQITARGTAIEQDVYIFSQPKVRMRDYVLEPRFGADGTSGLFNFGVIVKTHLLNTKQVTVYYDMYSPDSTKISSGKRDARFEMRGEDTVRFFANIPDIEAWSHENPQLYTIALRLQHEGRFTEYTTIRVGFREVSYDDNGILINGYPVELRGIDYVCPVDETTLRNDLSGFRQSGINFLRVENYPQRKLFYDLCDEYGLYVCDQANLDTHLSGGSLQVGGTLANDTIWAKAFTDRVMNMYYFSQNHPSVIMFSLGGNAGKGYNMYEAYLALKKVEKDRPVVYESAGAEWNTDLIVGQNVGQNGNDTRASIRFASANEWKANPKAARKPDIQFTEPNRGKISIRNNFEVTNMSNYRVKYTILSNRKVVAEGILKTNIPARGQQELTVPLDGIKSGKYMLEISISHKGAVNLEGNTNVIAEASTAITIPK